MQTEIRTTDEQRICSNPDCPHNGQPQQLDAEHFAPNVNYSGGYKTRCRDCERQTRRDRYKKKRSEELAYNKEWVETHRDERNAYQRDRNREIMEIYRTVKEQSA